MQGIWKSTFREIKESFGRFMAIFAIIALGVGFFAGLKVTRTGMVETVTQYLNEYAFYDYRLLSTLGYEQEDVDYFAAMEDVEAAEGSVSFDILYRTENGRQGVVKTYSVTEQTNTLKLVAGRMPQESGECVADSIRFGNADIGSVIYLSEDNDEETLEHFTHREYTIVGIVQSPLYIQFERGNTSLGTGRIDAFLYLLPDGFDTEYYTEIYVRFSQDYGLYSDEYDAFIEEKDVLWEDFAATAALRRYQNIVDEAEAELSNAREELNEKKKEGEAELADAAQTLADAEEQIRDGEQALADAEKELAEGEQTLREKEQELADAKAVIAEKETELAEGEQELAEGKEEWYAYNQKVESSRSEVNGAKAQLEAQEAQLAEGRKTLAVSAEAIAEAILEGVMASMPQPGPDAGPEAAALIAQVTKLAGDLTIVAGGQMSLESYQAQLAALPDEEPLKALKTSLGETAGQFAGASRELEEGAQAIAAYRVQVESAQRQLQEADRELAAAWQEILDAEAQLEEGRKALEDARAEITEGEKAIADAGKELEEAKAALAEKEAELADARQEYAEGMQEYEDALKEFNEKIAEAEEEIADAQKQLEELAEPDTYVLGRDTNVGYVCFENDSNIVEGIANIFPAFFFLVAALVCITTMNRMVEEQRTQIGVLKALGYGDFSIMMKYLSYSGLAALAGCIFGFFAGTWGFPRVIWFCYGLMYKAEPIIYYFDGKMAVISLVVSLLCSIGTTWLSCRVELSQVAATLMRPKAPKVGKRVFLEYIPFIWKRLSFLRKVSMRNIFRYKKRLFMMIMGISGCTALLVTGFGIKDSIADVGVKQFTEIQIYDIGMALKEDAGQSTRDALDAMAPLGLAEYTCVMEKNMDIVTDSGIKSIYLVAGTDQEMASFLNLHTTKGEQIPYPSVGEAVISNKLAEDYNVSVGDMIMLRDEEMHILTVTVTGIYENYLYHYVHISEDTWRMQMGEEPVRKTVYLNFAAEGQQDGLSVHEFSAELMKLDNVASVTVNADSMERLEAMMASLDIIVVVVIFCAAGLAFVVLYNLTNINITERIREIATIKVLGFYRNETSSYVFRENMMLTALGMATGLILGHFLHIFVMNEINIDIIAFYVHVKPVSFVYSALLTFGFAWLVDLSMGGKLERISMTESLKSVD